VSGIELLQLEVNTFADFASHGADIARWIEGTRREVIVPVLTDEAGQPNEWPPAAPPTRVGPVGPPGGLTIDIAGARPRSLRPGLRSPTQKSWERLLREFGTGSARNLHFMALRLDSEGVPRDLVAHLGTHDPDVTRFPRAARQLFLTMPRGDDLTAQQPILVDRLLAAAATVPVATGFLDVFTGRTYEDRVGRDTDEGLRDCERLLRGPYWANLLTTRHLEQLGGRIHVLRNAPVFRAQDLSDARGDLVYLQLTESLSRVSPTELALFEKFLAPVLPTAPPGWIDLTGLLGQWE
jgi:hypothetical protein